jgi:hypothetical protein
MLQGVSCLGRGLTINGENRQFEVDPRRSLLASLMTGRASSPIVAPTTVFGSTKMTCGSATWARASLLGISAATSMPVKPAPTTTTVDRPGEASSLPSAARWALRRTAAYLIPDTPYANIVPGQTGVKNVPINRMLPRSFFTNVSADASFPAGAKVPVRGIAFGGHTGVAKVEVSPDGGKFWQPTTLGEDVGKYSFRQWQTDVTLAQKGSHALMVRCTNLAGSVQPPSPNWNNGAFMRNVIETVQVTAA